MPTNNSRSSYTQDLAKRFLKNKRSSISLSILLLEVLLVFFLPFILHLDPISSISGKFGAAPETGHLFGFDELGRDILSRLIYGGRVSLLVAFLSTIVSLVVGVPLGLLAGYFRGFWEMLVMRLSDVFMAFPMLILILVVVSIVGPSMTTLILIMGVVRWPSFARLIHGKILSIREEEYVEAAKAIGTSHFIIILKYVLPNAIAPIIVQATFAFSGSMSFEAGLSFLGAGIQPPTPSWGNVLYSAQSISVLAYEPWIWIPTACMFLITVLATNFIGDGLREAFDPKSL